MKRRRVILPTVVRGPVRARLDTDHADFIEPAPRHRLWHWVPLWGGLCALLYLLSSASTRLTGPEKSGHASAAPILAAPLRQWQPTVPVGPAHPATPAKVARPAPSPLSSTPPGPVKPLQKQTRQQVFSSGLAHQHRDSTGPGLTAQ